MNKVIPEELLAESFPLHTTLVNQPTVRRFLKKTKQQHMVAQSPDISIFYFFKSDK